MADDPASPVRNQADTVRDEAGRWIRGRSGNPKGRPPASGWYMKTRADLRANAQPVLETLKKLAVAGDIGAARLLLERCLPAMRAGDDHVTLAPPGEGLAQQAQSIMARISDGTLTPGQGTELLQALAAVSKVVEVDDLQRRMEAVEAAQAERQQWQGGTPC